ncbi:MULTISPECIES: SgcJ/EcaC family oxidoreductase [unclassified Streptomyces]|uniref:SgcJ/EcaC family oxidoreductase n=1 Tax=unclassified Streptomyces TaxID=2593676 RepID=UPI00364364E3
MNESPDEESVTPAVRDLYEELLRAWNRRDAHAYAALFAPDAAMIGFDGSQVRGSEVERHLAPIFADHPTAAYVWKVREVRPLGGNAAILRAIAGMVPPGQSELNAAVNAVQTLVAEYGSGSWRVALFQNTPAAYHHRPDLVEQHTDELQRVLRAEHGRHQG